MVEPFENAAFCKRSVSGVDRRKGAEGERRECHVGGDKITLFIHGIFIKLLGYLPNYNKK